MSAHLPIALQAARLKLAHQRPYLASALWALTPVERPGLGTLAVDRWWRLYYDPTAVERWDVDHLAAVLYHEVCHLLRAHHDRAESLGADPTAFNVVGDLEINDDLRDEGVQLPEGALYPEVFGFPPHLLAEEYYQAVAQAQESVPEHGQEAKPNGGRQPETGADGQGDVDVVGKHQNGASGAGATARGTAPSDAGAGSEGDGPNSSPTADRRRRASRPKPASGRDAGGSDAGDACESTSHASSQNPSASSRVPGGPVGDCSAAGAEPAGAGAQAQSPAPAKGWCGSCAHGHQEPWEEGPPGTSGTPGVGRAEAEVLRRQVAEEIRRHAAQGRGTVPGHWRRWAEEKLRPKVDWRRVLASAVRAALADVTGAVDYSYRRPSRRQSAVPDVVLPSMRYPTPEVAIVVDTSGSVGDEELCQALAEVARVIRASGAKYGVHVLAVDSAVRTCRRVFRPEQVQLAGGGGTDMGVGIEAAAKLHPRPHVIVVLTDGQTPWPDRPPRDTRVVVGLFGDRAWTTPSWARAVKIGGDEHDN